jgi:hypothetical protein
MRWRWGAGKVDVRSTVFASGCPSHRGPKRQHHRRRLPSIQRRTSCSCLPLPWNLPEPARLAAFSSPLTRVLLLLLTLSSSPPPPPARHSRSHLPTRPPAVAPRSFCRFPSTALPDTPTLAPSPPLKLVSLFVPGGALTRLSQPPKPALRPDFTRRI